MSEPRNWGTTVLGWFVVRDGESHDSPAPADPADRPPVDAPAGTGPAFFQTPPPAAAGGQVDFEGVFAAAGIDHDERDRVARSSELLASLPSETPVAVRKQIVEAAMKAFGVPLDKIIEAGVQQIQALEGYIRTSAAETDQLLSDSRTRIDQLEREIRDVRSVMDQRTQEQAAIAAACNTKKIDVQRVLEFFGQDAVARVVRESPKLHDPSAHGE
ncbi:MAG TPA: hypothetical protein VL484_07530 [Vicinamibacterales bacterium]|jgi:hypothetical protein|nr:hypothetical protein [Vicinamibacterales bacterium]